MSEQLERMRCCIVCGHVNNRVTMRPNGPTEWEDCGHSSAHLIALAMLPVEMRWPVVDEVTRRALRS